MPTPSKKPAAAPKPNYGYLNRDWQGPDTREQAITRSMWNLPGGGKGAFRPENFGYPQGMSPPGFEQSSNWVVQNGWELPLDPGEGDRVAKNRRIANSAGSSVAQRYPPGVSPDAVLAGMVRNQPDPGMPYAQRAQQRALKRRNDVNLLNDITQQQSVPRYDLRTILWGQ